MYKYICACVCVYITQESVWLRAGAGESRIAPPKLLAKQLWVSCQLDPSTAGALRDSAEDRLGGSQDKEANRIGRDNLVKEFQPVQAGYGTIQ